jgi:hypothetical protein
LTFVMTTFPTHLTDDRLVAEVGRLATCVRTATAQLIAHLVVMDDRSLYQKAGYKSLFLYCFEGLRLSEHASYTRIEAVRAARAFPVILERLADGSITLTTVRLLAPHLTAENYRALLRDATHKRVEEVKEQIARIAPRPDVAPSIRKLPSRRPAALLLEPKAGPQPDGGRGSGLVAQPVPTPRPAMVTPLAPDRYEFRFTGAAATRDKLRYAQDLLRHVVPSGDPGEVVDRALTVLIESLERKRFGATDRPRAAKAKAPHSRHIPANVRRTVWARDGGRCAFVGDGGRRCEARSPLQFHHLRPDAASGPATVENIALRCAAHNRYEADLYFGPIWAARGAGVVEETLTAYGLSVRPSTRFKTSCVSNTQ